MKIRMEINDIAEVVAEDFKFLDHRKIEENVSAN
ncbi:hypothetical protein FHU25_004438 [Clostridium saccharobutylicum]|nr:hypothetical protein [Clostridium saccharobutylicum]